MRKEASENIVGEYKKAVILTMLKSFWKLLNLILNHI